VWAEFEVLTVGRESPVLQKSISLLFSKTKIKPRKKSAETSDKQIEMFL
jgi:hypothetical protein